MAYLSMILANHADDKHLFWSRALIGFPFGRAGETFQRYQHLIWC